MSWIYGMVIVGLMAFYFTQDREQTGIHTETTYSDFKVMVEKGYANEIVVNKHTSTLLMYVKGEHVYDVFHQHIDKTGKKPAVTVSIGSVDQV